LSSGLTSFRIALLSLTYLLVMSMTIPFCTDYQNTLRVIARRSIPTGVGRRGNPEKSRNYAGILDRHAQIARDLPLAMTIESFR